jgi:putative ATP-binding cassette transporter
VKLLRFLLRASRRSVLLIGLAGFVSGALSAAIIAVVNEALHSEPARLPLMALAFAGIALARLGTNAASQLALTRYTQRAVLELCREVCRRVLAAPLRRVEELGAPRVLTTLTDDVNALGTAIQVIPALAFNVAIVGGCSLYLAWISWKVFVAVVVLVLMGAGVYRILAVRASAAFRAARAARDALFRHFRSLTEGIKELKMHQGRRQAFLEQGIDRTSASLHDESVRAAELYVMANGWAQALFYLLIALVLFLLPSMGEVSLEALTGYVFATLYLMAPVWGIIGAIPTFARGQVALDKVEELRDSFNTEEQSRVGGIPMARPSQWHQLRIEGATFAYDGAGAGERGFVLGPIDFSLRPGEAVFVVGGNGSGKSTFVKLLTGLYRPQSGEIWLDDRKITPDTEAWYREHFSVVFFDFYLFDALLGLSGSDLDARASQYLARLQLKEKVTVKEGAFSTTSLSQGQRKRLALLTAYLEDRSAYVFDEWAADQDPQYKEVFYTELLPELKARGKAVVIVTHDDRFFHLGDRVIKLDYGRIVESFTPESSLSASLAGTRAER